MIQPALDTRAAIRLRHSTRRYSDKPIPGETLELLMACAQKVQHVSNQGVRFDVVSGVDSVGLILSRYAGIYGLVSGAPHLLLGILPTENAEARLDVGYVLEHVVLEATRQQLGTCWITGSYHPDEAGKQVEINAGETVAAVVALGYPRLDRWARMHDEAIHRIVASNRRKPLKRLAYDGQWGKRWSPEGADPALLDLMEHTRLAPSARNLQPWRFIIDSECIHLALTNQQPIDGGIAMAHISLVGAEIGLQGSWMVRYGDPELGRTLKLPRSAVAIGTYSWK